MLRIPPLVGRGALALIVCLAAHPRAARGQTTYKIAEGRLRIESISAQAQPANPVVPKNTMSALRVSVRAGERELSAAEVAESLGAGFKIQAELSGPGLPQTITLPRPGDPVLPDPLLLVLPPLSRSGGYELRGMRIAAADGRAVLDVQPQATTLRIIEQVLITSVQARPLTRDEIRERGILLDNQAYLGFEFAMAILLESEAVSFRYPVVFDREGLPHPPSIPLPPLPSRNVSYPPLPQIVPMILRGAGSGSSGGGGGDGGGGGGGGGGGPVIPSILVIPGNVGYLKQFFAAQLMVANGAPAGSGLSVRGVTATIKLPPGPDLVPGNADDPLALPPLETGPAPSVLPVRGLGADGEPGTPDDVDVLAPSQQGQAEFLVRGEQEGFHTLDFDIEAVLDGLPVGPQSLTGKAKGGVLVRNPYFDVAFTAPSVVRKGERFKLYATLTNMGRNAANDVNVTLDASRMSGARLVPCPQHPSCSGTVVAGTIAGGDAQTVEFLLESERTGQVIASYMKFQPGLQGRLHFTLGVGERGIPLSPDTLVLPASVEALPTPVVDAAMRVLGQGWSIAQAAPVQLPGAVARTDKKTIQQKALALAEAGMRVQLGQPVSAAVRDLLFDFYGGETLDEPFDQLLRTTAAGRDLAFALGAELAGPAGGNPAGYEQAVARVAASGPDAMTFAIRGVGDPVTASVADALGRKTEGARSLALPLSEVPGAVLVPLGAPATASHLGVVTAPQRAPYTITVSGPAELSVSYPRGGTRFSRATVTTAHPARVLVDFASGQVVIDEDVDADGDYDEQRTAAATDFAPEGARLLSAHIVGQETLAGASGMGLQIALLFDRMVDAETSADKTRYQLPNNRVAAAKRQLSGRLVFASLSQPEGAYIATSIGATGIRDARGVEGPSVTVPLVSRVPDVGAVVSGRVMEADGRPLAGAIVRYMNRFSCVDTMRAPIADAITDGDGRYELRFVRQDDCGYPFALDVWDPVTAAKRTVELSVRTPGERIVADIALLGRGSVTGIVRDGNNQPSPGAVVRVISVTDPNVGAVATADGDGRYTVHNITVGAVNATAVQGILVGRGAGVIAHAGGTATVDVQLEGQSARISGTVRKLENGQTSIAPGIPVLYYIRNGTIAGPLVGYAYTDVAGGYALEGMPAGDFRIMAVLNYRDRASVDYHADPGHVIEDLDLIVEVPPEAAFGTVRGVVRLPNGTPAAGVVVNVNNRGVLSASDGSYEIAGLPLPSNPQVVARTTDGTRTGSAYAVLTTQQPVAQGIDITLSGMGRVVFTVFGPTGAPLVGQSVGLLGPTCASDCGCSQKATDTSGQVSWDVPLGTWGAKAIRWTNGKADVAEASAHLTHDGLTAFGVIRLGGFGHVAGVVLDNANNNPLHGASVVLTANKFVQGEGCRLLSIVVGTRSTNESGQFEFRDVNAGPVVAWATHGIVQTSANAGGTLTNGQTLPLTIRLSSTSTMAGELSGTVYEPDGTTHAGAGVQVTVNGPLPDVTVYTNADGVFRFAEVLPQGSYRLTARDTATGHVAGKSIYLRAGQDAVHDIRLLGRGTVVVRVVDGGGRDVESAQVRIRGTEFPNRVYEGAVQPGMEGRVTLDQVVEGPYAVDVSDAFGRGGRASFVLPAPDATAEVKVSLTVVGTVQGHFVMPDGSPIPYGAVRLITGGRTVGQITTSGSSDIGFFSFSYVPAGQLRLEALDPATGRTGLAVGSIEAEGQVVTLDIRAQALGTVQGTVTSNGLPQAGALVDITSGTYRVSTVADPQGFYKVVGVPEGRPTVQASLAAGYLKATRSETLLGEGTVLTVDIALRATGTVEGTVTEADGQTPALALVGVYMGGVGGGSFTRNTNLSGEFEFERVASGKASIFADELASTDRADAQIEVPADGTIQVPLRLNGVGSLRGVARASGGAPTAGTLWVTGSGAYPFTWGLNVGPNGEFSFPELMAGPFTLKLKVMSNGITLWGSASGTIAPDQETVIGVQLEPSGTVTGVILRANGAGPAFGADVTLTHAKGTARLQVQPDGRFTFTGVPLGPITVRVHDPITTGRVTVRNLTVATNGQVVDLGTLVLDATPPTITPVDPLEGGTRTKLSALLVVDLADVGSGLDTSTYGLRYGSTRLQPQSAFTFTNGRLQTLLDGRELAIGQNRLTVFVQDLAGNLTEQPINFTVTGATARGTVRWPDGTIAPGVQVTFYNTTPVTTDGSGQYVKTGMRGDTTSVRLTEAGTGIDVYRYAPVYDGDDTTLDLALPGYGWITGTVRRSNGTLAAGVNVAVGSRTVATAADGTFNLGAFALNGYTVRASDAATGEEGQVNVTLSTFRQVAQATILLNGVGRVIVNVKDGNNAAVPNAVVRLTSSAPLSPTYVLTANTLGTADFPKVLSGTITATGEDTVRNLAGQAGGVLTSGGTLTLNVTVASAGTVTGSVRYPGGAPAAGVSVDLDWPVVRHTTTSAQGAYTFATVPLGAVQVRATGAGGDSANGSGTLATAGQTLNLDLTLHGTGAMNVLVLDSFGAPAPDAYVKVTSSAGGTAVTGVSGPEGTIQFPAVLAGTVTARAEILRTWQAGQTTGTLAVSSSLDLTVTLEPVGTIRGRVLRPDGVTPAANVEVRTALWVGSLVTRSGPDGTYELANLPLGYYVVRAWIDNRTRAQADAQLTTNGQIVTRDLVLHGAGTVSGTVKDPQGVLVSGVPVTLYTTAWPHTGTYTATTNANGQYSIPEVPVGPFTMFAQRGAQGQRVDAAGSVDFDGQALVMNLQLLANSVTLPLGLKDGNDFTWYVSADGAHYGAELVGITTGTPSRWDGRLSIVTGGTTYAFAGGGTSAASEEDKRETVIRQTLAGLNVTRKAFVPVGAYFMRKLDVFENPSAQPVTLEAVYGSSLGQGYQPPTYLETSSGDAVLDPDDRWVLLDNALDDDDFDPATMGRSFRDAQGVRPDAVTYDAGILTQRWSLVIPPQGKVALMQMITAQPDRPRVRASAERLAQLPPEVLAGLSPDEGVAIANFALPPDLVSALPPLPLNDGVVDGRVFGGDGTTLVLDVGVFVRSRSPHYGRPWNMGTSNATYRFVSNPGIGRSLPRAPFEVRAEVSGTLFGVQTATVVSDFATTGVRDLTALAGGTFTASTTWGPSTAPSKAADRDLTTTWSAATNDSTTKGTTPFFEVRLPALATIHEVRIRGNRTANSDPATIRQARIEVRDAAAAVLWSTVVNMPPPSSPPLPPQYRDADVPVPAVPGARAVRIVDLLDGGAATLAEVYVMGELAGGSPSHHAPTDIRFEGRGVLAGRVRRSDGTGIPLGYVYLRQGPYSQMEHPDASGDFLFPVVPPGTYSLESQHPDGGDSVTVPGVVLAANQKTVQDIVYPAFGRLQGAFFSAANQPVSGQASLIVNGYTRTEPYNAGPTYVINDLPPGTYTVTGKHGVSSAQVTANVTVTANGTVQQDFVFPPVGTVEVWAKVGGAALSGASVHYMTPSRGNTWIGASNTNALGKTVIINVPGPEVTVRVRHPDSIHSAGFATGAMAEGQTTILNVAVPGVGTVSGVVRTRNGVAVPSATVTAVSATDETEYGAATANASGVFQIIKLPVAPFRLRTEIVDGHGLNVREEAEIDAALTSHGQTLSIDPLTPRGVIATAGERQLWELPLAAGQPAKILLFGTAIGGATALPDTFLEVYGPDGQLVASNDNRSAQDLNSEVNFTASAAGTYVVMARAAASQTGGYHLGTGNPATLIYRAYVGTTVGGVVTRQSDGAVLPSATVRLVATTPGGLTVSSTAQTNAGGEYSFGDVPRNAVAAVSVLDGSGTVLSTETGTTGAAGTTLNIALVSPSIGSVEVHATIGAQPYPNLAVTVTSDNPYAVQALRVQQATTGADGRLTLAKVPAGAIVAQAIDPVTSATLEASGTLAEGATLPLELHVSQSDQTAPAAVTNLAATATGLGARLSWTAPGDDGTTGTAAAYDIRYATVPITAANFSSATAVAGPNPTAAGTPQSLDVGGLTGQTTYYFALVTRDEAYNWSPLSNVASATPVLSQVGLKLWLRADAGITTEAGTENVTAWADQSGNANHATPPTAAARPLRVLGEANGLPVLRFDGTNDALSFATRITSLRTVFWVVRENASAAGGWRYLLNDTTGDPFSSGTPKRIWSSTYTHANVKAGETRVNGSVVDGTLVDRPTTLSSITLVTAGGLGASGFTNTSYPWHGDLAELIVYDRAFSDDERRRVEDYLAVRYGLYTPPAVPRRAPLISPNGGRFSEPVTVTLSGSDVVRYTLDGSDPTTSSELYAEPFVVTPPATVKARAWAADGTSDPGPVATVTFLSTAQFSPASVAGLKLWVRADAGVTGDATVRTPVWVDQSGLGNSLVQSNPATQPVLVANAAGSRPALRFDGTNDFMDFTTRLTTIRTVFWVVKETATTNGYRLLLGDPTLFHFHSGANRQIWDSNAHTNIHNGVTRLNGPAVNGTTTNRPTSPGVISVVTNGPVTAANFSADRTNGRHWQGDLAELIVYDVALSPTDRRAVEEYLAARYGITLSAP